jgi:Na+-translocating ferredoxin:NAD+ oxidoreductase RnfA subunit
MNEFLSYAILFGVVAGGFFGLLFTANSTGLKKIIGILLTMVITGCIVSGIICLEHNHDKENWNNGKCPTCGIEWEFSNAVHTRNGRILYYWRCSNCNKIIELHSNFESD